MLKCVTHKVCYETKEIAEEALIQHHSRHHHRQGAGPVNIYQCHDCGYYHFTSKGPVHSVLDEKGDQIRRSRDADDWERKLR